MEWEVVETKRLCWLRHQPTAGVKVRVARLERKCTGEMIKDKINGLWWLTGYGNERHESHMTSKLQAWASWRLMVSSELLEGLLLFRSLVLPASVYHCPNLSFVSSEDVVKGDFCDVSQSYLLTIQRLDFPRCCDADRYSWFWEPRVHNTATNGKGTMLWWVYQYCLHLVMSTNVISILCASISSRKLCLD